MAADRLHAVLRAGTLAACAVLAGCAGFAPVHDVEALPGVHLPLPRDAVRNPRAIGIDSEAAEFDGRGYAIRVDRGVDIGLPSDPGWSTTRQLQRDGRRFDILEGLRPGDALPAGVALVERVTPRPHVGANGASSFDTPRALAIHLHCNRRARCDRLLAALLDGLRVDDDTH